MAIVHFTHRQADIPADAVDVQETTSQYLDIHTDETKEQPMWTWKSHVGLCLFERERNMYDDSDFYMVVWNEEKQAPETLLFASTRGWTYPAYASKPDASEEIHAKYNAWERRTERHQRAVKLQERRRADAAARRKASLSRRQYQKLVRAVGYADVARYVTILGQNLRSEFRKSLASQIRTWIEDDSPKYRTPLSPRQAQYL